MNRTTNTALLALPILLGGCAYSTPIHFTDGKPAQLIECGGNQWGVCYAEANDVCQEKGYEVLSQEGGWWSGKVLTVRCQGSL